MDNRVVALQGKSLDGSIPIIFPAEAFERTTIRAHRLPAPMELQYTKSDRCVTQSLWD